MRTTARRFWVQAHLWLGLAFGLVLALVAASGALLAFSEQLLRLGHQDLLFPDSVDPGYLARRPASELPLDHWATRIAASYPQLEHIEVIASPRSVPFPADTVLLAGEVDPEITEGKERHLIVSIDPASGTPLGSFVLEDTLVGTILVFHTSLLAGTPGFILITVTSFVALVSILSGVYLWWPRGATGWRSAFTLRTASSGRAWLISLHSVPAAWLIIPLTLLVLSGSYLIAPAPYQALTSLFSELRLYPPDDAVEAQSGAKACEQNISLEQAIALAEEVHPGQSLRRFLAPPDTCEPYTVSLMPPGTTRARASYTEIWVDRSTGEILQSRRSGTLSGAELADSWVASVHFNLGIGKPGTALVALAGVLLPLMFVTGLLAWLKRRRREKPLGAPQSSLQVSEG